jgi:hypothetical protein
MTLLKKIIFTAKAQRAQRFKREHENTHWCELVEDFDLISVTDAQPGARCFLGRKN